MATCRVCKRYFVYDDEQGYSHDQCGPFCHGLEAGRESRPIPASAVCFFKDGDKWCAVHGDFANLQVSPAGFGDTFDAALNDLQRQKGREDCQNCRGAGKSGPNGDPCGCRYSRE